ncbi:MAG: hypothetical protein EOO77_36595 [Oxalobacteraceae bacterium]|nr:MAG: hypothetical protein EOO77_36595 [Oxalobacteraceae bacterium]
MVVCVDYNSIIRHYLDLMEDAEAEPAPVIIEEVVENFDVEAALTNAIFKLRSHLDPTGGDYSLGFEQGLEMAATMLENIKRQMSENHGS